MTNKVYIIWIWGIGISAIARYYNENWYEVYGSDSTNSELVQTLESEWINIIIWEDETRIDNSFQKVIYTEAVPQLQSELSKAYYLNIDTKTYPQALAEIANDKKLIAVAGTHWKSTTTSLASIVMMNSQHNVNTVVWTLLKEFDGKNSYFSDSNYLVIEACEYKRSFLQYQPEILLITNIEVDHLDYYKDETDYLSAYSELINNMKSWGIVILNGQDKNCKKLLWQRSDIQFIEVFDSFFIIDKKEYTFPDIDLQVPGWHILFDAHLVYCLWFILNIQSNDIVQYLSKYSWVWRRMEQIGMTKNWSQVMSDYWHHPTEIKLTLSALKSKYADKKIITIFQPHQYNRTIELLEDFKDSFIDTDVLIIPNIYESRDSEEDKKNMSTEIFLGEIIHSDKHNWHWLKSTISLLKEKWFDNNNSLIVLLWAWNVDNLRYDLIK